MQQLQNTIHTYNERKETKPNLTLPSFKKHKNSMLMA